MNKLTKVIFASGLFSLPILVSAQQGQNFGSILDMLSGFINDLIPFIIGLAVLVLLWGIFKLITSGGDETKRKEAINLIIWGVIFLFVMVSIWGFVNLLSGTFGLDTGAPQSGLPTVPGTTQ
ncbi:MAG: hypothetical protein WDZ85_01400 [Candidatus Paceibacterota bacterium]